ncbi:uncharacterized protein LOC110099309 [Dendrobium catenatum]|uniref:uncharacterized protein LOC110099309 n=1 Tax=Dendrobium catenatum TaxID=906689 RepID=UPI0009F5BA2D|nr:uncharacterized protein LOC110099309 [Dendrobium catenatum]
MSMPGVWGGKLISLARRISLVKSVLLSYSTYHSTLSMVPKKVLYEVDKLCRKYIWNKSDGTVGLHYVSWDLMCKLRRWAGLGINFCSKKTGTLIAKLAWRYIQEESLMHKFLFPKFGPILKEEIAKRNGLVSSKLICNGGEFLRLIIRWTVGIGKVINAFEDICVLDKSLLNWPTFVNPIEGGNLIVDSFICDGVWNMIKLKEFFGEELLSLITSINIQNDLGEDRIELIHNLSSKTIVALAIEAMEPGKKEIVSWKWFGRGKLNPIERLFWWRLINNAIPTNQFLCYRRLEGFDKCPRGCEEVEEIDHIIFWMQEDN